MSNEHEPVKPEGTQPASAEPGELKDEELDQVSGGTAMNNLQYLALQTKVQNVSQTTQAMSNIVKSDSDAKLNAVRNIRS